MVTTKYKKFEIQAFIDINVLFKKKIILFLPYEILSDVFSIVP